MQDNFKKKVFEVEKENSQNYFDKLLCGGMSGCCLFIKI